jgi:hypothetical protein
MEFFTTKSEADKIKEEIKNAVTPDFIEGIVVDENHQLSEDAKFGHELAKNPIKWYQYFNS